MRNQIVPITTTGKSVSIHTIDHERRAIRELFAAGGTPDHVRLRALRRLLRLNAERRRACAGGAA